MTHLLNLLAAIALLVWGTQLVRTGILRVLGANLRNILARSVANRLTAAASGIGVTALLQSSTASRAPTMISRSRSLLSEASKALMAGACVSTLADSVTSRSASSIRPRPIRMRPTRPTVVD